MGGIKYKERHLDRSMIYVPCTDCTVLFTSWWSVCYKDRHTQPWREHGCIAHRQIDCPVCTDCRRGRERLQHPPRPSPGCRRHSSVQRAAAKQEGADGEAGQQQSQPAAAGLCSSSTASAAAASRRLSLESPFGVFAPLLMVVQEEEEE